MIGFINYFDEEQNKFNYREKAAIEDYWKADIEPDTNISGIQYSFDLSTTLTIMNRFNKDLEAGRIEVIKCKDCGKFFILNQDERIWFDQRNLNKPKRCANCRKIRKERGKQ